MVAGSSVTNHQAKLNYALRLLKEGSLRIYGGKTLANMPIKIEGKRNDDIRLIGLKSDTEDRIWGEYNPKTGELVFLGIAKTHEVWRKIIMHDYGS